MIRVSTQQSRFHAATLAANTTEIDLVGVTISVGEQEVLVDADLTLREGVRYGVIGRNGAGKSTLFSALSDRLIPGLPPALRVHIVTQVDEVPADIKDLTALESVLQGHTALQEGTKERDALTTALESSDDDEVRRVWRQLQQEKAEHALDEARRIAARRSGARGKKAREEEIKAEEVVAAAAAGPTIGDQTADVRADALERLEELRLDLEMLSIDTSDAHVRGIMTGLGFSPVMIDGPYTNLSGGWRSRVRLATALIVQTDILILDEPTNFMDLSALLWLEKTIPTLTSFSTLLITSHDQTFLDRVAEKTIALRHQRLDYFDGPPGMMYAVEEEARRANATLKEAMAKKKDHIQNSIAEGRKAAKATGDENRQRMVKSRQKKLDERWGLEQSAKGTRFKLNRDLGGHHLTRRGEIVEQEVEQAVVWRFEQPPELRQKGALVSLEKVSAGWGKRVVVGGVSMVVHSAARIALVGANGRGKSTLAKALASDETLISGTITRHPQARIGYFAQHAVDSLSNLQSSAITHFLETCGDASPTEAQARSMLGRLGLQGSTASNIPVNQLSGGQKVRLVLACLMYRPPHLLILDEVTTHLDVQSIRALAAVLRGWEGAVVLVTHDRWFARAVVDGVSVDAVQTGDPKLAVRQNAAGQTFRVGKNGLKLLEGGIAEYEAAVSRR
ncbi:P-loop containing nucleoside triphosphate hydrolase protein [Dioszegia hungarica]|uniref:P-loop containing nucleoside triphosphate hydrolase protein n=1 Tax=Dioszegia hungarica TaxID=4972 RepID=A0AA38HH82_9TREE|nr:P-loop containing nucleoside triphosphate hydrolase protein [Dioszegia hungarica]KAI9639611.1 P-loop containing nucleoside triphosphate hydrolase protein [Dioszegia hungarica]